MSENALREQEDELRELHFLNQHHSFPLENWEKSDGDGSAWARLKVSLRNRIRRFLFGGVLGEYLHNEQEYQANLVRLLNRWKSETEVREHGLRHSLALQDDRLRAAEAVIRGLERIIAVAGRHSVTRSDAGETPQDPTPTFDKDYSYLLLENRYRGSEEVIAERLAVYVPYFTNLPGPVLEIGSGRGELLNLFREAKIQSYGVELDAAMVERSRALGVAVLYEDGIQHLRKQVAGSLGGVIAIQVVEHLPFPVLKEFLELCRTRVAKGGRIIVETIDTSSMIALSHNYFRDPTHTAPLHPETLRYLFELSGLEVLEVKKLSAFPAGFELQSLSAENADISQRKLIETQNENVRKLNDLLYGHQDYSIIATVS